MEQKKRQGLGSGTLGAHAPEEMSDEDEESATIAAWPEVYSTAWTAAAHRRDVSRAGHAPRVALGAGPRGSALVGFVHQYTSLTSNSVTHTTTRHNTQTPTLYCTFNRNARHLMGAY